MRAIWHALSNFTQISPLSRPKSIVFTFLCLLGPASDTISSPSAGDSTVRKRKFIEYYPYPKDAIYFEAYEAKGWGRHYNMGIGTLELRKKGSRLSL
jgi:hypothetical protein